MILYLFAIASLYAIWRLKDYFHFNEAINFSTTSTPLMKTPISTVFYSQEELFQFIRKCSVQFKVSYVHWFFGTWSFEVSRAKEAEQILGSAKHIDKSDFYHLLDPFLKTGLLTSNGEKWHARRRMLTSAFHFEILKEYLEVFREESDKLVVSLKDTLGTELNIVPIATQFTLNTICESAMGVELGSLGNDGIVYRQNIYEVGRLLLFRLLKPWLMIDSIYWLLGYRKQLDEVLRPVLDFTKSIIAQRKSNFSDGSTKTSSPQVDCNENIYFRTKKRYAMMDTLLQAERQGLIDDDGIIEETDTFTFEGHDTTSSAISFIVLLLAHHPEAQEAILDEIRDVMDTKGKLMIDDFSKFEYLDRVIKECLRIYPPVAFISRKLLEDFQHDGFVQPKGTRVNVHIFDVHRDPLIFPDPEKFDPDRFLPENCAGRSNFAFIAFSAGMRNCIGQRFAMLELKMVVTKLIRNFKILPVSRRDEVVLLTDLVLRSKSPIKVKFVARK